jgi:hypothetical protein
MKFSHMFRDLSSTRVSQFDSSTEKFVLTDEHKQKKWKKQLLIG